VLDTAQEYSEVVGAAIEYDASAGMIYVMAMIAASTPIGQQTVEVEGAHWQDSIEASLGPRVGQASVSLLPPSFNGNRMVFIALHETDGEFLAIAI